MPQLKDLFLDEALCEMKFSLRTLLLSMLMLGALPFWYQHFLFPFFVNLAICIGMSVHAFGEGPKMRIISPSA